MKYQLIILGDPNKFEQAILDLLYKQIKELGMNRDMLQILKRDNFKNGYHANYPAYCLYMVDINQETDLDILTILKNDATLILPIVSDLTKFNDSIPEILKNQNGFKLSNEEEIPSLVSCILEGFSLIRTSRKVFISYKRSESSHVAIQLYEALEKSGFDVFLDTHSIRPGEPFQEELWHRMTDSDIIVLLNTTNFLKSYWTKQELAKANSLSIGIIQVIWPNLKLIPQAQICKPIQLKDKDFDDDTHKKLVDSIVENIISSTEVLRARTLAARQDNLTSEFISFANQSNVEVTLHPDKFISIYKNNEEYIIIPTIGVPQSLNCNNAEELILRIKQEKPKCIYLLYDHVNIRDKWLRHLEWLNKYLPVQSLKLSESFTILGGNGE
ncbi:toll/interleukin-1 receptor domain-containing protein [Frischella perrara]|uniref:toll/interleukin-1 receptor domain-containing protein n=1 Tax=Frischella perrara TaxID=1267021 RepID=UPI0023F0D445|nr:toll/interleukin-1 receptor domain-containing protein [Frischella perrara]